MPNHVFVVSEWLAKENYEQELREQFKKLLTFSLENEPGCISARVTHQLEHPGSPTKSKYTIVLLQEYTSIKAFDIHCKTEYMADFFKNSLKIKKRPLSKTGNADYLASNNKQRMISLYLKMTMPVSRTSSYNEF